MPSAPTTQLYPEVVDASALIAKPSSPVYLPIGVEGESDNDGAATEGVIYTISTISEAVTQFGAAAPITAILSAVISQGAFPVYAVTSKKGSTPTLPERQAVWDDLASDTRIRIRLTDDVTQANLVELADSCEDAELVNNKQVCFCGLAASSAKADFTAAATAIASSRAVLVAPGVIDADGTTQNGAYAAAIVAAEVAKNADLANDLDLVDLPLLAGIEKAASGLPLFRVKVSGGVATNDFEDLLQDGVSPLQPSRSAAGAQITHLRTTYITDTSFDALSTRLIVDQVFIDVKEYVYSAGFLRRGNTEANRNALKAAVIALLNERSSWLSPVPQADGTTGYNVQVTPSVDLRQVTVSYEGRVVRGIQTIQVSSSLQISV